MRRIEMTVTTAADGTATAYSPRLSGKIHSVQYVKVDYADGVDFTITARQTGEAIVSKANVNASAVFYPRAATQDQAGAAALYAAGGVGVNDKIGIANDQVKIVIAQGGNAKSGKFHVLID